MTTVPHAGQAGGEEAGRRLFRYVNGDEWREHRAVMAVFAGTFFSEFTPDDVTARLAAGGVVLPPDVVGDRLESLRKWGNLAISSSVGNPTSVADYYRLRNRYLITRAGQEVHDVVEGVLGRVDVVHDVSTGRLRTLLDALRDLAATDVDRAEPQRLADLVRNVFDPHVAFTSEITQFFAEINHWQSRYDLAPEEFAFFAEVLVGYVAERIDEIDRTARPIAAVLVKLAPEVRAIIARMGGGLASRVDAAGLGGTVDIARFEGSREDDWSHLAAWFVNVPGQPSRIARLGKEAIAAVRTLTLNLTRLSRVGVGASSRRADFLRLAGFLDAADPNGGAVGRVVAAALGLYPSLHYGVAAADADDPEPPTISWWDAPRAAVPVSLRARGDTTNRGRTTPIADRSVAQRLVRHRRADEADARRLVDEELLAAADLDGARLSSDALARLQQLVGRSLTQLGVHGASHERTEGAISCKVRRQPGRTTTVTCPEGDLSLRGLVIVLERVSAGG
jgi:uncharacterized protein (TIGR02677 family)